MLLGTERRVLNFSARTKEHSRVGCGLQPIGNLKVMAPEISYRLRAVYAYIGVLKTAGCGVSTTTPSPLSTLSAR